MYLNDSNVAFDQQIWLLVARSEPSLLIITSMKYRTIQH